MSVSPDPYYCGTCRTALNMFVGPGGWTTYQHGDGEGSDHPPAPVPLADLQNPKMKCDFCSGSDPVWSYRCDVLRARARRITRQTVSASEYRDRHHAARAKVTTEVASTHNFDPIWSACKVCAELIEQRALLALVGRVVDRMPAKYRRRNRLASTRARVSQQYEEIFRTLVGREPLKPGKESPCG